MAKSLKVWDGTAWQEVTISLPEYATLESPTFFGTVELPENTSVGSVTNTEISYLAGLTDVIQTQLDLKSNIEGPTFTGTVTLPSTTSIGNVTDAEIEYLDGVTSPLQTQLNQRIDQDQLDNELLLVISGAI